MEYCVCLSDFTGERCDMCKRKNLLRFKCIPCIYWCIFVGSSWPIEVKAIYIQSLLGIFGESSTFLADVS